MGNSNNYTGQSAAANLTGLQPEQQLPVPAMKLNRKLMMVQWLCNSQIYEIAIDIQCVGFNFFKIFKLKINAL